MLSSRAATFGLLLFHFFMEPDLYQSASVHSDSCPNLVNFLYKGFGNVKRDTGLSAAVNDGGLGHVDQIMDIFSGIEATVEFLTGFGLHFLSHKDHSPFF